METLARTFEAVFYGSPIPMCLASPQDGITHANAAFEALVGKPIAEFEGTLLRETIVAGSSGERIADIGAAVMSGRIVHDVPHRMLDASGSLRHVSLSLAPIVEAERVASVVCQVVDVTDATDARQRLEQSQAELQQFASRVAHDLKSPLMVISSYADLIRDRLREGDHEDVERMLEGLARATVRASGQVDDILAVAQQAASDGREVVTFFALLTWLREYVEAQTMRPAGDVLDVRPTRVRSLVTHPPTLRTVLANLVVNAVKYAKPDHPLKLTLDVYDTDAGETVIALHDNGLGVARDQLEVMFEPGTRLAPSHATGSGSGLAESRRLMQNLGGTIEAILEGGEGLTLRVRIPQRRTADRAVHRGVDRD